jgi:RNA polymerase sigma factor (sigma-70 family)
MEQTRSTLLARLRDRADQDAWRTFDALYRSMLVGYARSRGLAQADAEDVGQQCAQVVLERIGQYQHTGSFKVWLRAIAEHKIADQFRKRGREVQAGTTLLREQPDREIADSWERHWSSAHLRYCAEMVRRDLAETTYAAFVAYGIEGRPAPEVAASLNMTVNQVYVAKHRVIERIRALMLDLTGEEPEGGR